MENRADGSRYAFDRLVGAAARIASEVCEPLPYKIAPILYFETGGQVCTDLALEAALQRAEDLGLKHLVVASTTGYTARRAYEAVRRHRWEGKLIVVTEHVGYHGPGLQPFPEEDRRFFQGQGVAIHSATHAFSSVSRSFRIRWQGIDMLETIAESFRRISRGTKVCLEITIMAADAGLIPADADVVAVGGTSHGCDTALVVRSTTMNYFFELKVREFIALPQLRDQELGIADKGTPVGAVQETSG